MTADAAESTARDLYADLLHAWNARDGIRFGGLFAPDGVSIGFDGSQMEGPEIKEHLERIFHDHPTATYVAKIRTVRSLGPDGLLLRAIAGMIPPGQEALNPAVNALQSLVAERRGEGWRIVLFQNTPAQYHGRPELVKAHTAELEQVRATGATVS